MKCIKCQQTTNNLKFCSRTCAVSYNNAVNPKRPKTKKCKCGAFIYSNRSQCKSCFKATRYHSVDKIADIRCQAKYQKSAVIRSLARRIYKKSNKPKTCYNCGYDKHYEVAHIKSIKSFPENTTLSVVNDLTNLVALCPNCHWEFDKGLLTISSLDGI